MVALSPFAFLFSTVENNPEAGHCLKYVSYTTFEYFPPEPGLACIHSPAGPEYHLIYNIIQYAAMITDKDHRYCCRFSIPLWQVPEGSRAPGALK